MQIMQAAVSSTYGSPDILSIKTVPVPKPAAGEVLVKVHASTVNRTDCGFLRGKPLIVRAFSGLLRPNSQILGCEFAGEVVKLGDDTNEFNAGDKVFGFKDDDYGFGGHAEYTTMPVKGMVTKIPTEFSMEQAAAALEGAHYALFYIRAASICAGDSVLVNGATGAIGSAAVQIINHMGAEVTAVCATAHIEKVKALGASEVIDYEQQNFTHLKQKFRVVFDAVGKSTFGQCKRLLTDHGIYMSTELGPYSQNPFLALTTRLIGKKRVLFPIPENRPADAQYLAELMQKRAYLPLIDRAYTLENIREAYQYVETGMKIGNVVIQINTAAN